MNIFRNPKSCKWIGRLVPVIAWAFWLVAILVPDFGPSKSVAMDVLFLLMVLSLAAYILWVYVLLPQLLFKGDYRGVGLKIGYFLFTCFTAGVGAIVWYFVRVDPVLRQMAAAQKGKRV